MLPIPKGSKRTKPRVTAILMFRLPILFTEIKERDVSLRQRKRNLLQAGGDNPANRYRLNMMRPAPAGQGFYSRTRVRLIISSSRRTRPAFLVRDNRLSRSEVHSMGNSLMR